MMRRSHAPPAPDGSESAGPLVLLVVDDDPLQRRLLQASLERPGRVAVETAGSAEEALARLERGRVDAILTDLAMPEMDGVALVRHARRLDPTLPIVVATAHASLERAVEGIRAGATDFLAKPVNADAVLALLDRHAAERPLREEVAERRRRLDRVTAAELVAGDHPRLDDVRRFADQVAATPTARVLITGESGTGKSLLARAIHLLSRAPGRFVEVNCAALPAQLLETELFGHEKGAFTDARALKRGLIESADRGTLLLDEISAMPLELQAKLLLFLESREIRRVGGVHAIPVRARVVAATNDDLRQRVRDRHFRQDLLYRLDVAAVEMPPLREMPDVVPQLAERFAAELCREHNRPLPPLDASALAALAAYPWPGNARELRNAVERALIFHAGGRLVVRPPVPPPSADAGAFGGLALPLGLTLAEVERRYLGATLADAAGDLAATAQSLGISRKTLWEKRRRLGL